MPLHYKFTLTHVQHLNILKSKKKKTFPPPGNFVYRFQKKKIFLLKPDQTPLSECMRQII